jgi:oxygen-independent coproporphyrinogen-3 oxidase
MAAAGLYLHLPFCLRKCPYCDFSSVPLEGAQLAPYLAALRGELALRRDECPPLGSVYLGGGTPTALPPSALAALLAEVRRELAVREDAEVTVEANPGTVDEGGLAALRAAGANRLSLGVQSFDDRALAALGRIHDAAQAHQAVQAARRADFDNLNLDLIFAVPGQTEAEWEATLQAALEHAPEHLSVYGLTFEPGTPFHAALCRGELQPAAEETQARMFERARARLLAAGYRHYEISNYALPGRECRHNLNYWRGGEYLGLGASAHSFLGGVRWSNVRPPGEYVARLQAGAPPLAGAERLSRERRGEESLMVGLRLAEGVSLAGLEPGLGQDLAAVYGRRIRALAAQGLLEAEGGRIRLGERGWLLASYVTQALLTGESDS